MPSPGTKSMAMPTDTNMEYELEDVGRPQMGVHSVFEVNKEDPVHLHQAHEASLNRQKPIPINDAIRACEADLASTGSIDTISSDEDTHHRTRGDSFNTSGYASTKPSTCVETADSAAFAEAEIAVCSGGEAPNITTSPLTDSPPRSCMSLPSPPVTPEKDATRARVSQRPSGWHTPLLHSSQLRTSQLRSASASPITPPESPEPDSPEDLATETKAGDSPVDCSISERLSLDSQNLDNDDVVVSTGQAVHEDVGITPVTNPTIDDDDVVVSSGQAVHKDIGITPVMNPTIDNSVIYAGAEIAGDVGNTTTHNAVKDDSTDLPKTMVSEEVDMLPLQNAMNKVDAIGAPSDVYGDIKIPAVQNVPTGNGGFRARSAYYGSGGVSTKVVNVPDRTTPPGPRGYYGSGGVTTKVMDVPKPLKRKSFEDEYFTVKPLGGSAEAKQLLAEQKSAIAEQYFAAMAANKSNSRERRRGWLSTLRFRRHTSGTNSPRPSTPINPADEGRLPSLAFPDLHSPGSQFPASIRVDNGSYSSATAFGGRC